MCAFLLVSLNKTVTIYLEVVVLLLLITFISIFHNQPAYWCSMVHPEWMVSVRRKTLTTKSTTIQSRVNTSANYYIPSIVAQVHPKHSILSHTVLLRHKFHFNLINFGDDDYYTAIRFPCSKLCSCQTNLLVDALLVTFGLNLRVNALQIMRL